MFLEVKINPKKVVIQKKNRAGKWFNLATIQEARQMDYKHISSLLSAYHKESGWESEYRAVIIAKKTGRIIQVLSTSGVEFYNALKDHKNCYFSVIFKDISNNYPLFELYSNVKSSPFASMDKFQNLIEQSGGIKNAKYRKDDINSDEYIKVWDLTFNNNTHISVGFLEAV